MGSSSRDGHEAAHIAAPSPARLKPQIEHLERVQLHSEQAKRHSRQSSRATSASFRSGPAGSRHVDDIEKQAFPLSPTSNSLRRPSAIDHDVGPSQPRPRFHTLGALLFLALPAPLLSLLVLLYALVVLIAVTLASPLRLCLSHSRTFSHTIINLILKALSIQYTCVFCAPPSSRVRSPYGSMQSVAAAPEYDSAFGAHSLGVVLGVALLSPLVAVPLTVASCIIAFFWLLSAMTAHEQVDNSPRGGSEDGHRLARSLVRWWVRWLDGRVLR